MKRSCARAPVRVDPAGGGTDAPPFSVEHGGLVVNMAVARHVYASVDRLPPGSGVAIYSEDLRRGVTATSVDRLPGGELELLSGFVRRLVPPGDSLLLVTESDVPAGAGLGGSGALGVAVVAALDHAYGQERSRHEIAALANEIERKDLGYPGGDQDSYGAALGGIERLEYPVGGKTIARRLDVPVDMRLTLEASSLLIYTNEAHVSGKIHQDIKESYSREGSPTLTAMFGLRESAARMATALERGELGAYVAALNDSSKNLYLLHPSCDSEAHREMFRALDGVILGGKTCGAGGGGFLLAHAKPGHRRECIRRAERLGAVVWPLVIDAAGVERWAAAPREPKEIERYVALAGASDGRC